MAVALRSQGSPATASTTSITLTMPSGVQVGDYLVAFIHSQVPNSSTDLSCSDWTRVGPAFVPSDSGFRITGFFARVATASEPSSYTFTIPGLARNIGFIAAFSGVDTIDPIQAFSGLDKLAAPSQTLNVSTSATAANLYTLEVYGANFASPNSYALTSYGGGLDTMVDAYQPLGVENTSVSRSALRVWGGVASPVGIPAHTVVTSGVAQQACAGTISLRAKVLHPTISGYMPSKSSGGASTISIEPNNGTIVGNPVATGDWMVVTLTCATPLSGSKKPTVPFDWINIVPFETIGTGSATVGVWAKQRLSGEVNYSWTQTTTEAGNNYQRIFWVSGAADISTWLIGSFVARESNATDTTTLAPSVTTTVDDTLAISISLERTIAAETDSQVTVSNFTKELFDNTLTDVSITISDKVIAMPGATGDVTTTYPNPHAHNGIAGIIAIPPALSDPADMPQRIGYIAANTGSTMNTSITLDPNVGTVGGTIADGDWMIAVVGENANYTLTPPAGWTQIHSDQEVVNTYRTIVYARQRQPGDTSYTFTITNPQNLNACLLWLRGAADVSQWVVGPYKNRATAPAESTTITPPSITTITPNTQVLSFGFERTIATETDASSWTNTTKWIFTQQDSSNNSVITIAVGHKAMLTPGATGDAIITYPNNHPTNGWGYQIGIPAVQAKSGLNWKVSNGASLDDAWVKVVGSDGTTLTNPGGYKVVREGYASVTQMLSQAIFCCAHRGGSQDFPEMSLYAYGQSAMYGYPALEISLARTSDGVWFGLHDATLDRTSLGTNGTTLDPSTMTWAQVQAYQIRGANAAGNPTQPSRPYMRWEELMNMYYETHVIFVDPKVAMAYRSEMLDMMDAMPGTSTDRFVCKYYGIVGGTTNASGWNFDAKSRGYKTWGYFYETDSANFATYAPRWDILGMDYGASQAAWAALAAAGTPGTPIMGHICPNQAAADMALAKGAVGLMVSGTKSVNPGNIT